jgi:hypothetical protein
MELSMNTRRAIATNATHLPHIVVEETPRGQNVYPFRESDTANAFAATIRLMGGSEVREFDMTSGKGVAFNAQAYSIARKRSGM